MDTITKEEFKNIREFIIDNLEIDSVTYGITDFHVNNRKLFEKSIKEITKPDYIEITIKIKNTESVFDTQHYSFAYSDYIKWLENK